MTRRWFSPLTLAAVLTIPVSAHAELDLDALHRGVLGCPEIAADPNVGNLGAFLCQPQDRTNLDAPINLTGNPAWEVRAGFFHAFTRPSLIGSARGALGEEEFGRLQNLLINGQVLSRSAEAFRLALLAEGDFDGAWAILGSPEDSFDANIPALLATRPDSDRYGDLRSGQLHSLGARDSVSQWEPALAETLSANLGGLPVAVDADGISVYNASNAQNRANPFFLGPDGQRDTSDDLPFVLINAPGQAAGYSLGAPLQGATGTPENELASFDGTFGRNQPGNALRPIYSATAQIYVASVSDPGATKLVELYGVYSDAFLINQGCVGFGTYNTATGQCLQGGVDVSAEAQARGCDVRRRQAPGNLNIGVNLDGQCIELNTNSPAPGSLLQFEVLDLLGDLNARPPQATSEPVDLTDFRSVADGGELNTLPARPRAYGTGNVSFPVSTPMFRRNVDVLTGAPLGAGGADCVIRTNAQGVAVGPNGIAGDGDDQFPSAGYCTLWSVPDGDGPQLLKPPADVATSHSVNQTLFHTLCTLSFDADEGFCAFDRLNYPYEFGFTSLVLSGLGNLGAVVLQGVGTIVPAHADGSTSVIQRGSVAVVERFVLPIEPLALQDEAHQDLGLSMQPGQSSLLGCGEAYASACSFGQQSAWNSDPAIRADLTRAGAGGPSGLGGIDLMNADASVLLQEFAVLKHVKAGALVGTTRTESGLLYYQTGLNFSRDGQQDMDIDTDFTRQGQQINPPDPVAALETSGQYLDLTPEDVVNLGEQGRAEYQIQPGNLVEADGWIEGMPWAVNQELLDRYGAIVFEADPDNVLDLDSPLNRWNGIDPSQDPNDLANLDYSDIDGEYCARWMNGATSEVATPFNLGCTALETVSANFERLLISLEVIGQDRVFDAPESLAELVAILDGDPSNDATGDPIAGPDGIFARNQFVISDEEMDFEVVAGPTVEGGDYAYIPVEIGAGESPQEAAARTLLEFDPQTECLSVFCYLDVDNVLVDPDDALPIPERTMILAMPVGATVDVVVPVDPNDPNLDYTPIGSTKVNLAGLQFSDLLTLRRLLASQVIAIDTPAGLQHVRMSTAQRNVLLGELGSGTQRGRDMDADSSADLDRNRDGIWDGQDDYLDGPVADGSVVCGSGIPGDLLQDGVQYSPYRADEKPGQPSFEDSFPDGLPPRSPVFCRELTALLGLTGPLPDAVAGQSDAFLWHGGLGAPGTDDDEDGFPDVVDNCATIANATQGDLDSDGVGDACDNCAAFPNPRVADDFLAANPWAIATGGQRDDDRDGFGNLCDADFTARGAVVGGLDLGQQRASLGKSRATATCGTSGNQRCAIFDLDQTGDSIDANDLTRFRELNARAAGPKCPTCPLVCESGDPANCD